MAEAKRSARPRQADPCLRHALGVFRVLAVPDHLGRQPADGNSLLSSPAESWVGKRGGAAGAVPLRAAAPITSVAAVRAEPAAARSCISPVACTPHHRRSPV